LGEKFPDLRSLVADLRAEHDQLRGYFTKACSRTLDRENLRAFGETLSRHIRKEERQLFEGMQSRMSAEAMSNMGEALDRALAQAATACLLPNQKTNLHGK